MNRIVRKIAKAKREAGPDAYLWFQHDAGDCILWETEEESEGDSGVNALERWYLPDREDRDALLKSGLADGLN